MSKPTYEELVALLGELIEPFADAISVIEGEWPEPMYPEQQLLTRLREAHASATPPLPSPESVRVENIRVIESKDVSTPPCVCGHDLSKHYPQGVPRQRCGGFDFWASEFCRCWKYRPEER